MFAKDGYDVMFKSLAFCVILAAVGVYFDGILGYVFYVISAVFAALTLNFFRDPDRVTPEGDDLLIAPADGKVVVVKPVEFNEYIGGPATQVSIFLSALDVHVNRVPANGTIEMVDYHPGEYLLAWHEKASELNEHSEFGLKHTSGTKIYFKQITGYVARRIVYHLKVGDKVNAGNRFGMMKFGSRMDILLPSNVDIYVKEGDRTTAGATIMGRFN